MFRRIKQIMQRFQAKPYSREDRERIAFERMAREQFLRLKEKGLGITIMTL